MPHFSDNELRKRITYFERMHNLKTFIFETPFIEGGGEIVRVEVGVAGEGSGCRVCV